MEQTWNLSCPAKVGPALLLGGISCSRHSWTLVQFPLQCPSTHWTGSHQGLVRRFPVPHEMVWGLRFSLFWVVNFPPDSFQVAVASAGKRLRIYAEVSLSVLEKEEVAHPIILCFKHGPLLCSFNNLSMVVAHDVPSCKSVICNHSCIQENIKLWGIYEVYPQLLKRKQCHHNIFSPCNKNTISYLGPYLHQSLWWRDPSTSESWHVWWVLDCWWHPVSGVAFTAWAVAGILAGLFPTSCCPPSSETAARLVGSVWIWLKDKQKYSHETCWGVIYQCDSQHWSKQEYLHSKNSALWSLWILFHLSVRERSSAGKPASFLLFAGGADPSVDTGKAFKKEEKLLFETTFSGWLVPALRSSASLV